MTGVADRLRRSPALTRALFGVRVPGPTAQGHWDLATLALRRALDGLVRPGMRMLEMGCGEAAVLSVHAARKGARVLATDVAPEVLAAARRSFSANGVAVETRVSDLFGAIGPEDALDLVVFNPPYVPTSYGARKRLDEPPRVWDGGPDGAAVIRRFFDQAGARAGAGERVLVGFNTRHVAADAVEGVATARGFRVAGAVRSRWNPALVLVLER